MNPAGSSASPPTLQPPHDRARFGERVPGGRLSRSCRAGGDRVSRARVMALLFPQRRLQDIAAQAEFTARGRLAAERCAQVLQGGEANPRIGGCGDRRLQAQQSRHRNKPFTIAPKSLLDNREEILPPRLVALLHVMAPRARGRGRLGRRDRRLGSSIGLCASTHPPCRPSGSIAIGRRKRAGRRRSRRMPRPRERADPARSADRAGTRRRRYSAAVLPPT